jgi:hypothetical protein
MKADKILVMDKEVGFFREHNGKLADDRAPIMDCHGPFFCYVPCGQKQKFGQGFIVRKNRSGLGNFAELSV